MKTRRFKLILPKQTKTEGPLTPIGARLIDIESGELLPDVGLTLNVPINGLLTATVNLPIERVEVEDVPPDATWVRHIPGPAVDGEKPVIDVRS